MRILPAVITAMTIIECIHHQMMMVVESRLVAEEDTLLIPHWLKVKQNDKYDKLDAPKFNESSAVNVSIEFYVENIGNFQVTTMDYDLDIYFIERWTDFRLRHGERDCMILNDRRLLNRLWIPDLYFANSKMATYNDVTVPNFAFLVCPNGDIRYSVRISLKMTCMMNLKIYPFDVQRCNVKVLPYGSTTDKIGVKWKETGTAIAIDEDIMETDLKLTDSTTSYCNGSYYGREYSCLIATFTLSRTLSLSLIQIYVPTSFIVIISWISFWIDPSSVPGRVGLAVTTLLTLSTQAAAMTFQLPPVGYAKALDYWLGICLMFLFGTLIEFTIVNNYTRRWQSAIRKTLVLKEDTKRRTADTKEPIIGSGGGQHQPHSPHDENYLFYSAYRSNPTATNKGKHENGQSAYHYIRRNPVNGENELISGIRFEDSFVTARMYQSSTASYMADMNAEDATTYQQQPGLDTSDTGVIASSGVPAPAAVPPDDQVQPALHPAATGRTNTNIIANTRNGEIWKRRRKTATDLLADASRQILLRTNKTKKKQTAAGSNTNNQRTTALADMDPLILRKKALQIDKLSRIMFPICFVLFAIGYWFLFVVTGEQL